MIVHENPGDLLRSAGFPAAIKSELRLQVPPAPAPRVVPTQRLPNALALIATRNYIPYAKVTASTFAAHHPEFHVFLLLVDGEPADAALFKEGNVVLLNDLEFPQAGFYMLTPPPRPEQFWVHPTRADTFNAGLINAGSFAMNLSWCEAFLQFWREANLAPGAFFEGAGFQTDQQYLNWALVNVPGVYVLRSTRYNVAYWNLHERDLRRARAAGSTPYYEVDGEPLGFFHFSGYDINDRFSLSRHDGRHSVYNLPAIAEILGWYSDTVRGSDLAEFLTAPYRFDRLANGYAPTKFVREILKRYEAAIPRFNALTETGADELCAFLMSPLPATGQARRADRVPAYRQTYVGKPAAPGRSRLSIGHRLACAAPDIGLATGSTLQSRPTRPAGRPALNVHLYKSCGDPDQGAPAETKKVCARRLTRLASSRGPIGWGECAGSLIWTLPAAIIRGATGGLDGNRSTPRSVISTRASR